MSLEVGRLLAPFCDGPPAPLAAAAQCWRAGVGAGTLGLQEDCVSLEHWRLAIAGDFLREHSSPAQAAALSGMEAAERVASWFASETPT